MALTFVPSTPLVKVYTNREDLEELVLGISKTLGNSKSELSSIDECELAILFYKKRRGYLMEELLVKREMMRRGIPFLVLAC
jgi:hypothetical protein